MLQGFYSPELEEGCRIVYDDGRDGHTSAYANVLSLDANGMIVQFDDRADTTYIKFTDGDWMRYIRKV